MNETFPSEYATIQAGDVALHFEKDHFWGAEGEVVGSNKNDFPTLDRCSTPYCSCVP